MQSTTERDLARGLRNGEFILHYQPKYSLHTNGIVGAEALARLRLPDGTLLPPSAFIPLADRTDAIKALTLRLLARLVDDLDAIGIDGSRTRLDGFAGRSSSSWIKNFSENRSFEPH